MMAIAWAFIRPYLWKIALAATVILTVLAILARFKHAGRLQERVEAQARTIETVKRRKEITAHVQKEMRKSGESANDRLRRKWMRE